MPLSPLQIEWLDKAADAAHEAQHIFPSMAACEAGEESNYGLSMLAKDDCNYFGMKQHQHPTYGTVSLPTREYLGGAWRVENAQFVKYPDLKSCFEDRMATLRRLAAIMNRSGELVYPHYAEALAAPGPFEYVIAVSKSWSTDPNRASNVMNIYNEWFASKHDSEQGGEQQT